MIKVKVPATSANLGPGFDTLGLALNLYNTFSFKEIPKGLEIEGCDNYYANEKNLVYTSMLKTFNKIGYETKGIRIEMDTDIPISRGLGSSAACILGGVMGANELAKASLSKDEILEIATEIEGHPDNIAPALFGGLVVSVMEDKNIYYNKIDIASEIKFVALIPDFTLSTTKSREVLPSTFNNKDAIYNIGRVSLLLSALSNGRFDLLKISLRDKVHQPYRKKLIPKVDEILNKCYELGSLGVYLSGAGPTIMAIVKKDDMNFTKRIKDYLNSINYNWNVKELDLDLSGAI
ncbi:homoserine kinase [Anaerosalibacter massiliensis]|uniref:Homoserine kinase n=1 Tax=Anaerosalibacter massiliensis TaxID=1347392 RepID=A0A9X2MIA8_9FIRM|nr:homoserine kinase [Anaerosalibacter massiliensis]MCR2044179.1 homoserine kinase [Anaerosalibacter massiliensis]